MDVVIISHFCNDFSETDKQRFLYIGEMLNKQGHKVELVTSNFNHITKSHRDKPITKRLVEVTFLHESGYSRNVCIKRFLSHYEWGKNVIKYLLLREKPDVIYCAVPSLTGPNLVAKYCEKNGIRFIIDVQDLWPEAFQMIVNIPIVSTIAFALFKVLADGIYKRADAICAVSDTYCQRAAKVNKKVKDTTTVFLGTELSVFDKYAASCPIMKKREDEVWLAYCGTLGSSYDLTCVIDALAMLDDARIRFIVMGDGPRKDEFEAYARKKNINAVFTQRLEYNKMCSLLCACDITVNPIMHLAAQSIINKHADYAASGLPVVSTQESEEYRALIDKYRMGLNCKNNNASDLSEKLKLLIQNQEIRLQMGANSRKCAEEKFDRKTTYPELIKIIAG